MKAGQIKIVPRHHGLDNGMFDFAIQCQPHVAIKLRRMFGGIQRTRDVGVFTIAATPGHAYELEWFRKLHPLVIESAKDRRKFGKLLRTEKKRLEAIAAFDADDYVPKECELAIPLRQYQKVAVDMAITTRSLLLADALGIGKTGSAIGMLVAPGSLPALFVAMTHLTEQIEREINRFAPQLVTHVIRQGTPYEFAKKGELVTDPETGKRVRKMFPARPDVIIINYNKLAGWSETLAGKVRAVVFDEIQELRHPGTDKYNAAKGIAKLCDLRVGMSVGADSRVELRGGPFGTGWCGTIRDSWDMIEGVTLPIWDGEYELRRPDGVSSRGWTTKTGFEWKSVKSFIRHAATKPMVKITAGGTSTVMTSDHSVFVASADDIRATNADEIKKGDIVPVDNGARWEQFSEEPFDAIAMARSVDRAQVVVDLRGIDRRDLGLKAWEWQNCHREASYGTRIPIEVYCRHRDRFRITGPVYIGRGKAAALPAQIKLSQWAYVFGFFIGDGWADKCRVSFAVEDAGVDRFCAALDDLGIGLRPEIRQAHGASKEVRITHKLFARLIGQLFPNATAPTKRIPPSWIFTWPCSARHDLLEGLVDSDGHRSKRKLASRAYATTSPGLAEDVRLLLRSLGASSTLHRNSRAGTAGGVVQGRQIVSLHDGWSVHWSDHALHGSHGHGGNRCRYPEWRDLMKQAPVRSVASAEYDDAFVYDIEMDGHPSFVVNGLLCHNSATPIFNYGAEIFAVLDVIAPDALGSWKEFLDEWCSGASAYQADRDANKIKVSDPAALGSYLRETGLMLRRTRKDVGRELPPLTIVRHTVDADTSRIDQVSADVRELAQRVLDRLGTPFERMQWSRDIDYRLRQATGIAKAPAIADFVRLLVESGESVLLGLWHHECYDIVESKLAATVGDRQIACARFTGQESPKEKAESMRRFVAGEVSVLMMSNRAGAGIDGLQKVCHTVVIGELDWSPKVHDQFIGRADRDGQEVPVTAYYLTATDGSDPVIADVLGIKNAQSKGIVDPYDSDDAVLVGAPEDRIRKLAEDVLARRPVATKRSPSHPSHEDQPPPQEASPA